MESRALIGELSISVSGGVVLTASSDIGLAWLWAEHEVNASADLPAWTDLPYARQCVFVADALFELRVAYSATE